MMAIASLVMAVSGIIIWILFEYFIPIDNILRIALLIGSILFMLFSTYCIRKIFNPNYKFSFYQNNKYD